MLLMLVTTKSGATTAINLATSPANVVKNDEKGKGSDEKEAKNTEDKEDKEAIGEEAIKETQTIVLMCAPHYGTIEPKSRFLNRCLIPEWHHLPLMPPCL